jgi:hypothetical protein
MELCHISFFNDSGRSASSREVDDSEYPLACRLIDKKAAPLLGKMRSKLAACVDVEKDQKFYLLGEITKAKKIHRALNEYVVLRAQLMKVGQQIEKESDNGGPAEWRAIKGELGKLDQVRAQLHRDWPPFSECTFKV